MTPDVARFVEKINLIEEVEIDYSRIPFELNPNYEEIKRQRKRKKKFKPKR